LSSAAASKRLTLSTTACTLAALSVALLGSSATKLLMAFRLPACTPAISRAW
jgi:hypothetical protein